MKVVLLERVEGRGALGDVVTVKDGFARNYLLPRNKALRATFVDIVPGWEKCDRHRPPADLGAELR